MEVRRATEADAEAIRTVGHSTWPATYAFAPDGYVEHGLAAYWSEEAVIRGLRETVTWVAEAEGDVIGMANLDTRRDPPVIWKLYVVPGHQGGGAGSALIRAAIAEAGGPVRLEYVDGNARAAAFYARTGFVEVARNPTAEGPDQIWVEHPGAATGGAGSGPAPG